MIKRMSKASRLAAHEKSVYGVALNERVVMSQVKGTSHRATACVFLASLSNSFFLSCNRFIKQSDKFASLEFNWIWTNWIRQKTAFIGSFVEYL